MTSLLLALNALLPFTDSSRPLWRDILQTLILCTFLYFGPQIRLRRVYESIGWTSKKPERVQEHHNIGGPLEDEIHTHDEPEEDQHEGAVVEQDLLQNEDGNVPIPAEDPIIPLAGAANEPQPQRRDPNDHNVGAKKAKSLARKDRRRAYNEFMREQGDAQRARDAEGAEEREKEAAKERERRRDIEAKIQAQKAREREEKKEREAQEKRIEEEKRARALGLIDERLKLRFVSLYDVSKLVGKDRAWVEGVVRREGYLGIKEVNSKKVLTMVTKYGWLVRLDEELMEMAYRQILAERDSENSSEISLEEIGRHLEHILMST